MRQKKEKRRVYAGAVAISVTGDLDFAIAIRTMILKNKKAYVQAGQELFMIRSLKMNHQESKSARQSND